MAMDVLARALAVSASGGGGGGGSSFEIVEGKGIKIVGDDVKTIINAGVRSITQEEDGSLVINTSGVETTIPMKFLEYKILQDKTDKNVYNLYVDSGKGFVKDTNSDPITIPKINIMRSGAVKTVTEDNKPVVGYKIGDKYIDIVLDVDGIEGTSDDTHLYILVTDLVKDKASDIVYDTTKSASSVITKTNVQEALDEISVLASAKTDTEDGNNGLMSVYDKGKLDNMGTFKDDASMKLAIDGLFSGYDMSGLDPDDDDGIANTEDVEEIFDGGGEPTTREAETNGSFTSLSADEIDDILGDTTTPDDSDDEDGDDTDLDTGDIDDILGI